MDCSGGATSSNWTEVVEDLLHDGDIDKATSLLESTVSTLEKQLSENEQQFKNTDKNSLSFSVADQLSTALQDLSKLYSAKGLSLKADQALSRAIQLKHQKGGLGISDESIAEGSHEALVSHNEAATYDKIREHGFSENASNVNGSFQEGSVDDNWEAIADHTPEELFPQQCLPEVSTLSLEDSKDQATKRRGRGTFAYKRQGLYSDNQSEPWIDRPDINSIHHGEDLEKGNLIYGSRHVLVLTDFPPSTRTSDLEKLFEKFKDQFVIRWVNDTTALVVFRTPSVAQEASVSIQCSFTMCILEEGDELLSSIPPKDLKPPRQRPQTSARTAQRLIAQGMGIKLPSNFGSTEFRKQEDARKNRIVSRHNMRDDAWGDD